MSTTNDDQSKELNAIVQSVLSQEQLEGFEKAHLLAKTIVRLKELMTPEYMAPIMKLQGNRLGFKTDRDDKGGYPEHIVKNCLIEAVLMGVQPFGNQFNIISSNTYLTKEGYHHKLQNYEGLYYEIIAGIPKIKRKPDGEPLGASIIMRVQWSLNGGVSKRRELELAIRMNRKMGVDAVIGKATRKARAWLWGTITGSEIGDGDVDEFDSVPHTTIEISAPTEEEIIQDQIAVTKQNIFDADDVNLLLTIENDLDTAGMLTDELKGLIELRRNEIIQKAFGPNSQSIGDPE